jgi:hypothetical protein
VSVGVALRASDGVVVIADGRTSAQVTGESLLDDAVKITAPPHDLPFVVMALGRASVNKVPINKIISALLEAIPYEDLRAMDLRTVTSHMLIGLTGANVPWPQTGYDEDDHGLSVGFHVLVAGYSGGPKADSQLGVEVWTGTVPTRGMGPQTTAEGVAICGGGTEVDALVYDLFDGFNDALADESIDEGIDYYRMRGLPTSEIRERAATMLRTAVEQDPDVFTNGRVGGRWLFASVGAGGPVMLETDDIGPKPRTF